MVQRSDAIVLSVLVACRFSGCAREAPRVLPEPQRMTEGTGQRSSRPVEQPVIVTQPAPPTSACGEPVPSTDRRAALGVRPSTTGDVRTGLNDRDSAVFLAVNGAAPPARTATNPQSLRLDLTGPAFRRPGQALGLRAEIHNGTAVSTTVIRSNDGSFEHMREPFVDLYLQNTADQRVYRYSFVGGRCGMMNRLTETDLVSVASRRSSSVPFAAWASHLANAKIPVVGRFRVWVVYRQCDWRNAQGSTISLPIATPSNLFEGQLVSNAVEIEVR